jgi:microcystin-dependent protein
MQKPASQIVTSGTLRKRDRAMEAYIGQIIAVGFNFAPLGWELCDGRTMAISQFDVLYSLLGTTYGGDGQTTFNLPDLRGRGGIGQGQKPSLANYALGQAAGSESVTLTSPQLAGHSHTLLASAQIGTTDTPATNVGLATNAQTAVFLYDVPPTTVALAAASIGAAGGSQPHENRQPLLAINYIICTQGIYPPQS